MTAMFSKSVRLSDFETAFKTKLFRDSLDIYEFLLQTRRFEDGDYPVWKSRCDQLGEQLVLHHIEWSAPYCPHYPKEFYPLNDPPLFWTYQGHPVWDGPRKCLAVVGSRRPSQGSLEWLDLHLSTFCREQKWTILSGGARGIDQRAHLIALRSGCPTIATLPSGLQVPYPKELLSWRKTIIDHGGCFVSQFPPHESIRKFHFILRNRLIVALATGVFVVEANRKSGSRMTAQFASEQGKDLATLAVSPMSFQGLGSLDLIHDGAQMLRDYQDLKLWSASLPERQP